MHKEDVESVSRTIKRFIGGNHLDLACGTAFWLSFYHTNCESITLIDQSPRIVEQAKARIRSISLSCKTKVLCSDVFQHPFLEENYESALVGFLLSHLDKKAEEKLFALVRITLKPEERFIVIDSTWSKESAETRDKIGIQNRLLNDGGNTASTSWLARLGHTVSLVDPSEEHISIVHAQNKKVTLYGRDGTKYAGL